MKLLQNFPPIYFYIPKRYWPAYIPQCTDENWSGFGLGIYAWTLQTYLRLKADNFPCQLVDTLPTEGIMLVHRNILQTHRPLLKPNSNLLLICLKAEALPYPYAQLHIVQNPVESLTHKHSYFLPHWPQPGLIPRDPSRGARIETVAFFGHTNNLAPELKHDNWAKQLQELGLQWRPVVNTNNWDSHHTLDTRWNDYSQIDVVVAVRSFDRRQTQLYQQYRSKPATKLYNAWLAGTPAVLGPESAYRAERQHELDYLEVNSIADLIGALKQLQRDRSLHQAIIQNGLRRAQAIQPANITQHWRQFLEDVAAPTYYQWRTSSTWSQQIVLQRSYWRFNRHQGRKTLLKGVYRFRTKLSLTRRLNALKKKGSRAS
ncbi:MAG: hypothetical protein QNJ46_08055 [Leptolyngbyaceae cyanobacterium MO_188.B28]|nr:hypothetical protein [Leptolyngbyaceae cyanobacterium MO_188.B28]